MKINHGANLFELSKNLGKSTETLIDFSSNINPYGISPLAISKLQNNIHLASIYPDPEYTNLKNSISQYCKCDSNNIILGSGATELISTTIKTINPKNSLLLVPAYSEYEKELNKINCNIEKIFYRKENHFKINIEEILNKIKTCNLDLIIICNPNNPTGTLISQNEIEIISRNFSGQIMIDETYIEFTDFEKTSAISLTKNLKNLIIIRGTSKFFGTPGIRLGYSIISNEKLLEKIKTCPNLWNINIYASIMGEAMFLDKDFINYCYNNFNKNFKLLFDGLKSFKEFKVYESFSNFILCEIIDDNFDAYDLYNYLLTKEIIIRKADTFEGLNKKFFRVCVLTEENILFLLSEIKNFIYSKN